MDLELSPDEELLDDAVRSLFAGHAVRGGVDHGLLERLDDNGFLDVLRDSDAGPIGAVLVAERAAEVAAAAPIVARVLVGPLAGFTDLPRTVGLVTGGGGLVRHAGDCDAYL